MKAKKSKVEVSMSPIIVQTMELNISGETPLLMERYSEENEKALLDLVTGKGKEKKKNRDLDAEVEQKIHRDDKGNVCLPGAAFKKSFVEASVYQEGSSKKLSRGSFYIMQDLIPIKFKHQTINKTVGRDKGMNRSPRIIWRPEFREWSCKLIIKYNASQITATQIVEMAKLAGFHIGIGGWRPQCDGNYGMFSVATS